MRGARQPGTVTKYRGAGGGANIGAVTISRAFIAAIHAFGTIAAANGTSGERRGNTAPLV